MRTKMVWREIIGLHRSSGKIGKKVFVTTSINSWRGGEYELIKPDPNITNPATRIVTSTLMPSSDTELPDNIPSSRREIVE